MPYYNPRRIALYTAAVILILVVVGLVTYVGVGLLN